MEKIEVKWNIICVENLQWIDAFTFQYTPLPPKQFDVHLLFWCFIYHMEHCC